LNPKNDAFEYQVGRLDVGKGPFRCSVPAHGAAMRGDRE
jgi:hypothetical protein